MEIEQLNPTSLTRSLELKLAKLKRELYLNSYITSFLQYISKDLQCELLPTPNRHTLDYKFSCLKILLTLLYIRSSLSSNTSSNSNSDTHW